MAFVLDAKIRLQVGAGELKKVKQALASVTAPVSAGAVTGAGGAKAEQNAKKTAKAIKNLNVEANKVQVTLSKTAGKAKQATKSFQQLNVAAKQNVVSFKKMQTGYADLGIASYKATESTKKTSKGLNTGARAAENFGAQMFLAAKRYAAFVASTAVAFKAIELIQAGTKAVIEFDQELVKFRQILNATESDIQHFKEQFLDLSVTTGTSALEIAKLGKTLAQAGFRGIELAGIIESLAKVPLAPAFEGIEGATEGVIAALNQFNNEGLTAEDVLDKLTDVSNNFAASSEDIAQGITRGGAAFEAIGGTLDQFIAAFTTIRSVTRESASSVGTALKTISSRLADPKIIDFLETKGIKLVEEGQFVGPQEALQRIASTFSQIENTQDRVFIATKLGGRRQISRFLALAQNTDRYNRILKVSQDSQGAFSRTTEEGLKAIAVQIQQLVNAGKRLAVELGPTVFIPFIQALKTAGEAAIALVSALKSVIPVMARIAAIASGAAIFRVAGQFASRIAAGPTGPSTAGGVAPIIGSTALLGYGDTGPTTGQQLGKGLKSPFVQAGLLIATAELAVAFGKATLGLNDFQASLVRNITAIVALTTIIRKQTLGQFLGGGGFFGKEARGLGGAVLGSALSLGAVAAPLLLLEARKSSEAVRKEIVDSAIESLKNLDIDTSRFKAENERLLGEGLVSINEQLGKVIEGTFDAADIREAEGILDGIGRALNNGLRFLGKLMIGELGDLNNLGAIGAREARQEITNFFKTSRGRKFVTQILENVATSLADQDVDITIESFFKQFKKVAADFGIPEEQIINVADAMADVAGGSKQLEKTLNESRTAIRLHKQEVLASRDAMIRLVPPTIIGQLIKFEKAVASTTRTIDRSISLFDTRLAILQRGITAPTVGTQFATEELQRVIRAGGLDDLLGQAPDIQQLVRTFGEVEDFFEKFVTIGGELSALEVDPIKLDEILEKEISSLPDDLETVFGPVFSDIKDSFKAALETKGFARPDELRQLFEDEFDKIFGAALDGAVEATAAQLQNLNKQMQFEVTSAQKLIQFRLETAVDPVSTAELLRDMLLESGIGVARESRFRERPATPGELRFRDDLSLQRPLLPDLQRAIRDGMREVETKPRVVRFGGGPATVLSAAPSPFGGPALAAEDIAGSERTRRNLDMAIKQNSDALRKNAEDQQALGDVTSENRGEYTRLVKEQAELSKQSIKLQADWELLSRATQDVHRGQQEELRNKQAYAKELFDIELRNLQARGQITPRQAAIERVKFEGIQLDEQRALTREQQQILIEDARRKYELAQIEAATTQARLNLETQNASTINEAAEKYVKGTENFIKGTNVMIEGINAAYGTQIPTIELLAAQEKQPSEQPKLSPETERALAEQKAREDYQSNMLESFGQNLEEGERRRRWLDAVFPPPLPQEPTTEERVEQEFTRRQQEANKQLEENTKAINDLKTRLDEPGAVSLDATSRININIDGIDDEMRSAIEPEMLAAARKMSDIQIRRLAQGIAEKADTEVSTAITRTLEEYA